MPRTNQKDAVLIARVPSLLQIGRSGTMHHHELRNQRTTIGRADDNDIVLPHESVSRLHATIEEMQNGQWAVYDNKSKNGVLVNGEVVEAAQLENNDVIQIGIFSFRYQEAINNPESVAINEVYENIPASVARTQRGINKRVLIYGALGLVLAVAYLASNTDESKDKIEKPKPAKFSSEETDQEFDPNSSSPNIPGLLDPAVSKVEEELKQQTSVDTSFREAEQYFRRGQRDFSNKNYQRAIESFSTAYNLNRNHREARAYLLRSIQEAENLADEHLNAGVKYFESLQYSRAIYHFKEAIALMAHRPDHKLIKECQKRIELAKQKLQSVEIYP